MRIFGLLARTGFVGLFLGFVGLMGRFVGFFPGSLDLWVFVGLSFFDFSLTDGHLKSWESMMVIKEIMGPFL